MDVQCVAGAGVVRVRDEILVEIEAEVGEETERGAAPDGEEGEGDVWELGGELGEDGADVCGEGGGWGGAEAGVAGMVDRAGGGIGVLLGWGGCRRGGGDRFIRRW